MVKIIKNYMIIYIYLNLIFKFQKVKRKNFPIINDISEDELNYFGLNKPELWKTYEVLSHPGINN